MTFDVSRAAMSDPAGPPPIPVLCARRPTTPGGLVIPYGNVQLADGGCDFRSHHRARWEACWKRLICQVCGRRIGRPIVMLCGPRQLAQLVFAITAINAWNRLCITARVEPGHYEPGKLAAAA